MPDDTKEHLNALDCWAWLSQRY